MDKIFSINGPVVKVRKARSFSMQEMVYVGNKRLIGEVIRVTGEFTTIQVYEGTTGLMPGEPVEGTGAPMSATLGPGILDNIFDGIQRPLKKLEELSGAFIADGANVTAIDTQKKYSCTIKVSVGDTLSPGDIYLPGNTAYRAQMYALPPFKGRTGGLVRFGRRVYCK